DQSDSEDLLLMLDYGIYYEFLPLENLHDDHPKTVTLDEVQLDKNYALVISTNAGLWRYLIGDTIKFVSLNPYRIQITGRTKQYINAFGEELIVDNADDALKRACAETDAAIRDYTAGPVYFGDKQAGAHEWIVEFEEDPADFDKFCNVLDTALREVNSDYDAKRFNNLALRFPVIHRAPAGTFYRWMKARGKLGGQNKVPRLANDRAYLEDILRLMKGQ